MRIPLLESDLFRLATVLEKHQLSPEQINTARTVAFVLPAFALTDTNQNTIVLMIAPRSDPPTETTKELYLSETGVAIGVLKAMRALPLSDQQVPKLDPDMYLVMVRRGRMVFVNSEGEELAPPSLQAVVRTMKRDVVPPEASLTLEDICYSWHHIQICSEPAPQQSLSEAERNRIQGAMESTVLALVAKGLVKAQDINVLGTITDGLIAGTSPQANFLAAPIEKIPLSADVTPPDGALLGAGNLLSLLQTPGAPLDTSHAGPCAVRAVKTGENKVKARLAWPDGSFTDLPADLGEVRGELQGEREESLVILDDICFDTYNPFTQERVTVCIPFVSL